jgi:hypothetical protein
MPMLAVSKRFNEKLARFWCCLVEQRQYVFNKIRLVHQPLTSKHTTPLNTNKLYQKNIYFAMFDAIDRCQCQSVLIEHRLQSEQIVCIDLLLTIGYRCVDALVKISKQRGDPKIQNVNNNNHHHHHHHHHHHQIYKKHKHNYIFIPWS